MAGYPFHHEPFLFTHLAPAYKHIRFIIISGSMIFAIGIRHATGKHRIFIPLLLFITFRLSLIFLRILPCYSTRKFVRTLVITIYVVHRGICFLGFVGAKQRHAERLVGNGEAIAFALILYQFRFSKGGAGLIASLVEQCSKIGNPVDHIAYIDGFPCAGI